MINKRLTIVIVTYNSEYHIYDCLDSIYQFNDIGSGLEVIIVDNNSPNFNKIKENILSKYPEVLIVENKTNGGYGQGNNIGIKISHAPIIMIMNPDVRMIMPIFDKVCKRFEASDDITMYGIKQKIENGKNGNSFFLQFTTNPFLSIPLTSILNKLDIYIEKYMYFSGSCFFVRKKNFESVGCFDENIFMYKEEFDVHTRFVKNKFRICYDKRLKYSHLHYLGKEHSEVINFNPSKISLEVGFYLAQKYGSYTKEILVRNQIRECNIMLFREKILKFLNRNNIAFEEYNRGWKEYLLKNY